MYTKKNKEDAMKMTLIIIIMFARNADHFNYYSEEKERNIKNRERYGLKHDLFNMHELNTQYGSW